MSTKPLTNITVAFLSVFTCLLITSCVGPQSEKFPDTDIVYQIGNNPNGPKIGFVNADGSSNITLTVDSYLAKPTWSVDGKTLYALQWSGTGTYSGRILVWGNKALHVCQNYEWKAVESIGTIILHSDSTQAAINNAKKQLLLIDLNRCEEIKRYIDFADNQSTDVLGVSLSSDENSLLYTEVSDRQSPNPKYAITIMNVATGETTEIGQGNNPTWSPDGKWIAYIQFDGIYVMASDGTQSRQLVKYDVRDPDLLDINVFAYLSPSPRWSPNGQWLVYHKCTNGKRPCSIFKVEVTTGAEVKILDNGENPFWRSR